MSEKGKLIVFEGVNNAGATTYMRSLGKTLTEKGKIVLLTESRSCGDVGRMAMEGWQFGNNFKTDFEIECTGRTRLYYSVILPALMRGDIVLCRHYTPSSMVNVRLQNFDDKTEHECRFIEGWAREKGHGPDRIVLLDASPETVIEHMGKTLVSAKEIAELERKRHLYLEEVQRYDNRVIIDANQGRKVVAAAIEEDVFRFLGISV